MTQTAGTQDYERQAARIAELEHALRIIVNGATSTMGQDSGGWPYAYVRQAMLNAGRRALALPEQED